MKFDINKLIAEQQNDNQSDDFPKEKVRFTDDKRTEARMLAIQAVFVSRNSETSKEDIIEELLNFSGLKSALLDKKLFVKIANNAIDEKESIIEEISLTLNDSWTFDRLDPVAASILITAVSEIMQSNSAIEIIISEYMPLATAFLGQEQAGVIHGIIASIAKKYEKEIS